MVRVSEYDRLIVWRLKMSPLLYLCLWSLLVSAAMAATASDGTTRELDQTPSWAVAGVCAVIILISLGLEKVLHKLGAWLTERHKKALFEALEKVKAELMILGFISLLLTFGQIYILKICIPIKVADTLLPCSAKISTEGGNRRKLLWYDRRFLAAGSTTSCKEGKVPLISINGLHQLHILIFFLAVFHVLYSFITMMLGRLKIRGWKHWEQETSAQDYENSKAKFVLTHETSFVKAHTSFWTRIPVFFFIGCFLRQFFRSVSKSDYTTLRNGFISVHLAPGSKFNFQKYIKRSLEDDFQVVVGVSPVLWASFVIFLLLNVNGWKTLIWSSLIPVIIILAVGTKLQAIMTKMALEITDRHAVVQGIPLVQGSDQYFWFGRPKLLLYLIHFSLFQNAFQITYFFWIWYSFGLKSCFHADFKIVIARVVLGIVALCICSYITLPLYALVTQMGSRMKMSIFDEQTSKALKNWRMGVKKKKGGNPSVGISGSPSASPMHPSRAPLRQYKTASPSAAYEANEASDYEADPSSRHLETTSSLIIRVESEDRKKDTQTEQKQTTQKKDEFS